MSAWGRRTSFASPRLRGRKATHPQRQPGLADHCDPGHRDQPHQPRGAGGLALATDKACCLVRQIARRPA
ncbi:hypothetical protein [Kibdelosporangium philippinense]|uniref:hypothetical protein n=1 Tax=Kibdelosporangium philippinense TaxID=211113 RepID=UPI00360E3D27